MEMKMIIGGNYVDSKDGTVLKNYNPYTGELIGTVPSATKEDIDLAVKNAKLGQVEWSALRLDEKEEIIFKFLDLVSQNSEEIARLLSMEGGKTINECRGEIASVGMIFKAYLKAAATMYGKTIPNNIESRNTKDLVMTVYEPLGVSVCIGPYNYPISTMTNKVAPALCAGNSVIMKPASDTPMSTIKYADLMLKAGFPKNVIQVVTGSGSKIGTWFAENPDVALISLTGSTRAGIELQKIASDNLQRVLLELGGNDPFIVFDDCDLDNAVVQAINGRIYNSGQICSASKRFIVQDTIIEEFTNKLVESLEKIKYGDPMDEDVVSTCCIINSKAADVIENQIQHAVDLGAKCVYGGEREGNIIKPVVLVNVIPEMEIARSEEVFGPVFPLIKFSDYDEAISIANNSIYGLSAGVMTNDMKKAIKASKEIKSGTCVINGTGDYRNSYHGFGGYKMSGVGREGASVTLEEFSEIKTIVLKDVL